MLETILDFLLNNLLGSLLGGASLVAIFNLIAGFIMKQWLTEDRLLKWKGNIRAFFRGIGVAMTLGLSRYQWSKALWNALVEPLLILIGDMVWVEMWKGLKEGWLSDKPSTKGQSQYDKEQFRKQ
jgi:hypothetical protein